ncbi:MAG: ATP-binding protein [Myxococcota bacterium]
MDTENRIERSRLVSGSPHGNERILEEGVAAGERVVLHSAEGLGLASMQERPRLIHGDLAIRSKRGRGTLVHVRVPVPEGGGSR